MHPSKLSDDMYKQCYKTNRGKYGAMQESLAVASHEENTRVFYVTDENGELAGWLLKYEESVHIYVKFKYRRQGIGKRLAGAAKRHGAKYAYPWSTAGRKTLKGYLDGYSYNKADSLKDIVKQRTRSNTFSSLLN